MRSQLLGLNLIYRTMIYQTILPYRFSDIMTREHNGFSLAGANLIYDFYDSIREPIEFDPVAIRGEWTEYLAPVDAIIDFFGSEGLDDERSEYHRLRAEGYSSAEALEAVLGVPVLWDKRNPNLYVVGC